MTKRERMLTVLRGGIPDAIPSSYWFHFSHLPDAAQKAQAHLAFHAAADMDFMKIMYEFPYSLDTPIHRSSDWRRILPLGRKSPEYQKQAELIRRIQDGLKEDCMVFTTMFGAFKMAQWLAGEDRLMRHLQEDPQSVLVGTRLIAEMLADWAEGFAELGIDGIMYAAQYGEPSRFSKCFWEVAVKPCDELVLSRIAARKKYILLHMCGMAQYQKKVDLTRFAGYPMDLASWAVHSSQVSLAEGRALFCCPVLGGMDNYGSLTGSDPEAIRRDVREVIRQAGRAGLVLGADCVILERPSVENVRTAVLAAREA